MVNLRRPSMLVGVALLGAVIPLIVVMACGPDFEPDVFTPPIHPENFSAYSAGKLGVIQPGYWQADKVVAYRYLIGGRLSAAEQIAYDPPKQPQSTLTWEAQQQAQEAQAPANRWIATRATFIQQPPSVKPGSEKIVEINRDGSVEREAQLNCTDSAFDTAIATLQARSKAWVSQSAELKDWIAGQDAVFSNCSQSGFEPSPAPAKAAQLLREDRAYQIASAHFYAGRYDEAISGFQSVSEDKASPWSKWGEYLIARAEVRKAASMAPVAGWGEQAQFDPDLLQTAKTRLQQVAERGEPRIQHAALAELSFVNLRLEPQEHLKEVSTALAGPAPDPEFSRDLDDLRFLADHKVTADTDILQWMGLAGQTYNQMELFQRWNSTHSNPWLISALSATKPDSYNASILLSSAAKLPVDSPAYATANYYRVSLLIQLGEREQARKVATTLLDTMNDNSMIGSRNAVLALRMLTAQTFAAFLEDAPRTVTDNGFVSQAASNLLCGDRPSSAGCVKEIPAAQFDQDAADVFNQKLPASLWINAAESQTLPQNLREAVAWAAWVRAVGLADDATAKQLAHMLPPSVRETASDSIGFPATLALLRNPGLRPYLDRGVQRSASYGALDTFRDNWWCQRWDGMPDRETGEPVPKPADQFQPVFVVPAQKDAATMQLSALNMLPSGVVWLGRRAIDYVKLHPDDPNAAESLALTVRATRYDCFLPPEKDSHQKAVSKEAFQLLHERYPKSSWAAKTPYYF